MGLVLGGGSFIGRIGLDWTWGWHYGMDGCLLKRAFWALAFDLCLDGASVCIKMDRPN
jgi:hypothetical protein